MLWNIVSHFNNFKKCKICAISVTRARSTSNKENTAANIAEHATKLQDLSGFF
jgi:hypothetical protein